MGDLLAYRETTGGSRAVDDLVWGGRDGVSGCELERALWAWGGLHVCGC